MMHEAHCWVSQQWHPPSPATASEVVCGLQPSIRRPVHCFDASRDTPIILGGSQAVHQVILIAAKDCRDWGQT